MSDVRPEKSKISTLKMFQVRPGRIENTFSAKRHQILTLFRQNNLMQIEEEKRLKRTRADPENFVVGMQF